MSVATPGALAEEVPVDGEIDIHALLLRTAQCVVVDPMFASWIVTVVFGPWAAVSDVVAGLGRTVGEKTAYKSPALALVPTRPLARPRRCLPLLRLLFRCPTRRRAERLRDRHAARDRYRRPGR